MSITQAITIPKILSGKHVMNDIRNTIEPKVRFIDLYCCCFCLSVRTLDNDVSSALRHTSSSLSRQKRCTTLRVYLSLLRRTTSILSTSDSNHAYLLKQKSISFFILSSKAKIINKTNPLTELKMSTLYLSMIYGDCSVGTTLHTNHRMHNLYANIVIIFDVCKLFSNNLSLNGAICFGLAWPAHCFWRP